MSEIDNDYKRTVGSISGWDVITTQNNTTGTRPVNDHDYTVVDLELMLRGIKKMFNPKYLNSIENIIHKHIEDKDNPHKVNLDKLNTDVLQELYKLWLSEGYNGSRDDFIKVLFQYVKIASLETALKGESYDEVTSVRDVAAMLKQHDDDEDAHGGLLNKMFPGTDVDFDPTFSVKAYLGLPCDDCTVTRKGSMWILDCDGFLKEIREDTLAVDYTLGCATIPIFGRVENLVSESEDITNEEYYTSENGETEKLEVFTGLREDEESVCIFREKETVDATIHSVTYTKDDILTLDNEYYTVSCFVRPYGRDKVGIYVDNNVVGSLYSFVQFDLTNGKIFYHKKLENLRGNLYPLFNGWYRISMTFRAVDGNVIIRPKIYTLDIYDGDMTHTGHDGFGIGIFGLMVSHNEKIAPYIPSLGRNGFIEPTSLVFDIDYENWYNQIEGTWVFEFDSYHDVLLYTNRTAFNIGNGQEDLCLSGRYVPGYRNRFHYDSFNKNNELLTSIWCNHSRINRTRAVYSYSHYQHIGATYREPEKCLVTENINPNGNKLYLGTNRLLEEHFNGYFYGVDYYPYKSTPDQIRFLRGKK